MNNSQKKELMSFKTNEAIRKQKEIQSIQDKSKSAMIPFMYKYKTDFANLVHKNSVERINLIYESKRKLYKR